MTSFNLNCGDIVEKDNLPNWLQSLLYYSYAYDETGDQGYKICTTLKSEYYNLFKPKGGLWLAVKDINFTLNGHNIIISS